MSRFLRRNKPDAAAAEEAASLPPATSELILRPSSESKVPAPAQLSEEQQAKLKELEEWTRELHTSTLEPEDSYWKWEERWLAEDGLYARYLRAAKWDMANAKKRIQGTLEWRRSFKPDLIVPDEVKVEGETGKHIISGFDREGRPLLYLRPGRENTKPSERQIRYLVWSMERALDFLPPGQEKLCLVIDYKAATTSNNPSFSTSLKVLNILQNHYVERLGRAYVSSVPWFINAFFNAIGPFLDPVTKDKIRFNSVMTDFIPADQLDSEWKGGRFHYEFDFDKYWGTLLDFCGIAADGTRTHETYAKQGQALPSGEVDAAGEGEQAQKKEGEEGQTFSSFMAAAPPSEAQTSTVTSTREPSVGSENTGATTPPTALSKVQENGEAEADTDKKAEQLPEQLDAVKISA